MRCCKAFLPAIWPGLVLLAAAAWAASPNGPPPQVWTAVIPRLFPGYVYTWRLLPDGRYLEDGRDGPGGPPVQGTLSGRWAKRGTHMTLRQDGIGYVFDGVETKGRYSGILRLDGKPVSQFCAAEGVRAPRHCDVPAV